MLVDPVPVELVESPNGRSSCAARKGLLEGLKYVAPAGVLTVIEIFDLLLTVIPVLVDAIFDITVGSPKQRSS